MALVVQGLIAGPLVLAALYLILSMYCCRCLVWTHAVSPRLSVRKVFAMNCLLTSVLRVMSFTSIAVIAWMEYGGSDDDNPSATHDFYEKALVVLFDFPDFSVVSAYVLLFLVWCEAFVQARHHWLNTSNFQKSWILGYLVFNILLYSLQVALYSLLFFPAVDKEILSQLIYLTLSSINLVLPFVWLIMLMYLSLRFSGFPMASRPSTERLTFLGRIGLMWTVSRMFWGFIAMTSVLDDWLFRTNETENLYTFELVALFLFVEIVPVAIAINRRSLLSLGEQTASTEDLRHPIAASVLLPRRRPSLDYVLSDCQ